MRVFMVVCVAAVVLFTGMLAGAAGGRLAVADEAVVAADTDVVQNGAVEKDEQKACCEKDVEVLSKEASIERLPQLPQLPNIVMVNQDGESVRIAEILKDKITVINFIYTSCTSVCQILTSNFRQLEKALDGIDKDGKAQLVSISIDPETDTPARLRQYADRQRIDLTKWTLLVSGMSSIERLSRTLGFSNVDKATHAPGVVIWDDIDKRWQRFVGITPSHVLSRELIRLPALKS